MDELRLANAKLMPDAHQAALKKLDCLFTVEELVNGNPSGNTKSQNPDRISTIKPLHGQKMQYIYAELYYTIFDNILTLQINYSGSH